MKKNLSRFTGWLYSIVENRKFFWITLALFILQAVWLAITAIYPLPFDEFAHVGAIQLYAEQWSWVVTSQPPDSGIIGDLTREPSFLYRWIMSFPYRIFDMIFSNTNHSIVALRLLNVAMMTGGIILFRNLLVAWNISRRLIHIAILAFVMTPMVPFLAAHVNYDNGMFLLTPIVLWHASQLARSNRRLVHHLGKFLLSGMAAVLTKQTFVPLMLLFVVYVCATVWWRNRSKLLVVIRKSWNETPKNILAGLVIVGIMALSIMAVERYGGNLVRYGTFRPKCQEVQSVELCEQFGPWYRDNVVNQQFRPDEPPFGNPVSFSQYWVTRMMRGYFALFQHTPTQVVSYKEPYGPIVARPLLPIQVNAATVVAIFGVGMIYMQRRRVWHNPYLRFALFVCVGFLITQWIFNYSSYLRIWKAEAIQARYTLPILLLIFILLGWATNQSLKTRQAKACVVLLFLIFYVWGGGIAGWLIRADATWRWQDATIQTVNHKVQNVLRFTVVH